jgi:5-methylcytosine-specific restriction protein A
MALVLRRAGGRCERCHKDAALIVHHRIPRSQGGSDEASNLQALCKPCHKDEHYRPRK